MPESAPELGVAPAALESDVAATLVEDPPYDTWSLDPDLVLRLGVAQGDPDYQFSRIAYAARLTDGGVVVVDGGSSEIRWYGKDGTLVGRAAGAGAGPTELRRVVAAGLTVHDVLVLYDSGNQRLSWWTSSGELSQTRRLELQPSSTIALFPLVDEAVLVTEEQAIRNFGGAEFNYARDSVLVMVTATSDEGVDTIMRVPGRDAATWVGYVAGAPQSTRQFELPLGQLALVAGLRDQIFMVGSGRRDLDVHDLAGHRLERVRRSDLDARIVTPALRREYVRGEAERAASEGRPVAIVRAAAEGLISLLPNDREIAPFDRILVDGVADRVWLRDFSPGWTSAPAHDWTIHGVDGRVLARIALPTGVEILHVAGRYVVGVERDDMDVEYVVVFSINQSEA